MNISLFESLLQESESSSLDFKRDTYAFVNASDHEKSELLKDILAFTNAWRRTDAYILMGVTQAGASTQVVGVTRHIDDAQLQQFVNSKTQRPVSFSYEVFSYAGSDVGVISIPLQQRPVFLKSDYAKLKQNTVFIRRGSSTTIADPDEIARMGSVDASAKPASKLELGFADKGSGTPLGTTVAVDSVVLTKLPDAFMPRVRTNEYLPMRNTQFYEQLAEYVRLTHMLRPLLFAVTNLSSLSADDVQIEIESPLSPQIMVIDSTAYPELPSRDHLTSLQDSIRKSSAVSPDIIVEQLRDRWRLTAKLGRVRPRSTVMTKSVAYFGAHLSVELTFDARVYVHDQEPSAVPLTLRFNVSQRQMQRADLEEFERRVP